MSKTAMQILIDKLKAKSETMNLPAMAAMRIAINEATELLQTEKEQIVDACIAHQYDKYTTANNYFNDKYESK